MRVSLEGKGQAVDGDITTTGAVCIASDANYWIEGRTVLRVGDCTTPCPLCGEVGRIVEGYAYFMCEGRAVVMDGAQVDCACPSGSNRVVAPLFGPPPSAVAMQGSALTSAPSAQAWSPTPVGVTRHSASALPAALEPGFYIVPRRMSFSQVLMALAEHDDTLPISRLQMLNPTFLEGFKAGEIFVIGDPDNADACTREEAQLMAAAEHARRALAVLDFAESDFMMQHQAEIAGLLGNASQSMGVGKDMLEQGLKQVSGTLTRIEKLHQREFLRHGHLNSPGFFAERRQLLQQLDGQLKAAFLNKKLDLGNYERLKKSLNISTKSLVHHWSKAGGPGQIPGYATHLDKVARLGKYLKWGGHAAVGLGGVSSYLMVEEVCRAGETEACKRVRLKEAGSFTGSTLGGMAGGTLMGGAALSACGVFAIGTAGIGAPVCGIVLIGAGSYLGGWAGESAGEFIGEKIYESSND